MDNIDKIIEQEKQLMVQEENKQAPIEVSAESKAQPLVADELAKARQVVAQSDNFQEASQEVAYRDMRATLNAEALAVLSAEQRNALAEYTLSQEKKKLDYKVKYEKKLVKEEVKAEVYKRKVDTTIAMYGQYYKKEVVDDIDDNGEKTQTVRLKNFTTSKFVNEVRVFAAWYNSLEKNVRKIIWTTIKVVFFAGIIALVGYGLYVGIRWLLNSGALANVINDASEIVKTIK